MRKKLLATLLVSALAFSALTGCSGSGNSGDDSAKAKEETEKSEESKEEEKVEYDLSDETGIINVNLCEDFEKYGSSKWDNGSRLELSFEKPTQLGTWGYLRTTVNYGKITETTLESKANECASFIYAEDLVQEEAELFDMKGYKVSYLDKSNETAGTKHLIFYYLAPEDVEYGEDGNYVVVSYEWSEKYPDAEQYLLEQLDELHFDFDAYDFGAESESSESSSEESE